MVLVSSYMHAVHDTSVTRACIGIVDLENSFLGLAAIEFVL